MTEYSDLRAVTGIVRDRVLSELQVVLEREVALRAEIDATRAMQARAFHDASDIAAAQRLGADHAWHDWLGRRIAELNIELAQLLALKGPRLDAARQAFARHETLGTLCKRETTARAEARAAQSDRYLEDLFSLQRQRDQLS